MSRCKACDRQIETYDRVTPLNTQILESVYNIDPYATKNNTERSHKCDTYEDLLENPQPLYPTLRDLEGRPEEDLCTNCRTSLIEAVQQYTDYQFYGLE